MAKKQPKAVRVKVGPRPYPRGGVTHRPGTEIVVPEYAVQSITEASPPFGEVVETLGSPPAKATKVDTDESKDSDPKS